MGKNKTSIKEAFGFAAVAAALCMALPLPLCANEGSINEEIDEALHKKKHSSLTHEERKHIFEKDTSASERDVSYTKSKEHEKEHKKIAALLIGFVIFVSGVWAFAEHLPNIVRHARFRKIKHIASQQHYSSHAAEHGSHSTAFTKTRITKQEVEEHWK